MRKHLYKVPSLDYTGEDINIEVDLTVLRGESPILAATMCQTQDTDLCLSSITEEQVTQENS